MSRWQNFLNSLSTRGGAIFLLFLVCLTGIFVILHMIHHGEDGSMFAGVVISTFSSFSGALLLALKGSSESTASASTGPEGTKVTVSDSSKTAEAETPKGPNA
jgi:hypothetical protein